MDQPHPLELLHLMPNQEHSDQHLNRDIRLFKHYHWWKGNVYLYLFTTFQPSLLKVLFCTRGVKNKSSQFLKLRIKSMPICKGGAGGNNAIPSWMTHSWETFWHGLWHPLVPRPSSQQYLIHVKLQGGGHWLPKPGFPLQGEVDSGIGASGEGTEGSLHLQRPQPEPRKAREERQMGTTVE